MPAPQQPKATTPSRAKKQKQRVTKQKTRQHPHNKWVRLKRKMGGDFTRKRLIEKIATFLQSVLPHGGTPPAQQSTPPPITPTVQTGVHPEVTDTASPSLPFLSRAHESVFASPIKRSLSMDSVEGEASYVPGETAVKALSEKQFGSVASPYITSYVFHASDVDRDYGMRRDPNGKFRIGNANVEIDSDSNVIVKGVSYKSTKCLFELLTRKKVDSSFITDSDMKAYGGILQATHGHLENNDQSGSIKTTRVAK